MNERPIRENISEEFYSKVVEKIGINPFAFGNIFKTSSRIDDIIEFYAKRETDSSKRKELKRMTKESDIIWLKAGKVEMKYLSEVAPRIWNFVVSGEEGSLDKEQIREIKKGISEMYEATLKLMEDMRGFVKEKEGED